MAGSRFKQTEQLEEMERRLAAFEQEVADLKDGCHALLRLVKPIIEDWQARNNDMPKTAIEQIAIEQTKE